MLSKQHLYAITILRLGMGVMFVSHALLKILVFTVPGTVGFFESLGLPGFLAYAVIAGELVGGAMLIVGFQTRIVAWVLTPILLGATWTHLGNGWVFSNPNGGWEYPAFLVLAVIVLALSGPGMLALDSRR